MPKRIRYYGFQHLSRGLVFQIDPLPNFERLAIGCGVGAQGRCATSFEKTTPVTRRLRREAVVAGTESVFGLLFWIRGQDRTTSRVLSNRAHRLAFL